MTGPLVEPAVPCAVPCGRSVAGSTSGTVPDKGKAPPDGRLTVNAGARIAATVPLTDSGAPPHLSRDGAPDPRPPKRVRDREVFKVFHANYRFCLVCGYAGFIHAHHLILRTQGGDDVLENLVPLCAGCHDAYHRTNSKAVRKAIGRYLVEAPLGAVALEYLRSKRNDSWIERKFGVTLRVRGRGGEYEDL